MKQSIPLRNHWKIRGFPGDGFQADAVLRQDTNDSAWLDALPGEDVHSALMRHGVIADPAIGVNDAACRWVEERVWVYRTTFSAPKGKGWLVFDGLDTFAEVYLNGRRLARFENMLVEHTLALGDRLREGSNELSVCFFPVHAACAEKKLPEGFWINYSTDRAYARKAGYQFGWDWTPSVLTVGVWGPVTLLMEDDGLLKSLTGATLSIDNGGDHATVRLTAACLREPANAEYRFTILDREGNAVAQRIGRERQVILTVDAPRLWFTYDRGEPYLYSVECELLSGGEVRDRLTHAFGIRTVRMRTRLEDGRNCFVVELNGQPLCARGANWVPLSNRPSSVPDETYDRTLTLFKAAGMNLLCLWGGGIYEREALYRFCDREGLLVWQYFMFACGEYPDFDPAFVRQVRDEVEKVVARVACHPCVAMWIGNVESEMISQKINLQRPMYGSELFEKLIPVWLAELDPERYYLPSSPWGEESMNSQDEYDRHNWDVWFLDLPYTAYAQDRAAFASEFGVHASPALATVQKTCGADVTLDSFAFRYFNRDQSEDRIWYYLRTHMGEPKDLKGYIDLTMLVQAEALSFACDHFRRRFPRCGGALIWQLNDCCGVQSWSLIDVNLIPKAAYYAVRQCFAPIAVTLRRTDANIAEVWGFNDGRKRCETRVAVTVGSFLGETVYQETLDCSLAPGERRCIKRLAVGGRYSPNVVIANRSRLYYIAAQREGEARPQVCFFAEHKDLAMPPAKLEVAAEKQAVTIETELFADFVKLDGDVEGLELSDNYFHMPPRTRRTIRVKRYAGKPLEQRALFIKALNSDEYPLQLFD